MSRGARGDRGVGRGIVALLASTQERFDRLNANGLEGRQGVSELLERHWYPERNARVPHLLLVIRSRSVRRTNVAPSLTLPRLAGEGIRFMHANIPSVFPLLSSHPFALSPSKRSCICKLQQSVRDDRMKWLPPLTLPASQGIGIRRSNLLPVRSHLEETCAPQ